MSGETPCICGRRPAPGRYVCSLDECPGPRSNESVREENMRAGAAAREAVERNPGVRAARAWADQMLLLRGR